MFTLNLEHTKKIREENQRLQGTSPQENLAKSEQTNQEIPEMRWTKSEWHTYPSKGREIPRTL